MTLGRVSRRHVLLGGGGFALALPILRSLEPKDAEAVDAPIEKRFVAFATDHGGVMESRMFPDEASLTEEQALYADHTVRRGDLVRTVAGERASVSTILSGPADRLTDRIVAQMNVLRGLDIPFFIAHHTGGHLGNYARNDANGEGGFEAQFHAMPTIDQLLAWSPSFYPDLALIKERSLILNEGRLSWNWSNPLTRSGEIQEVTGVSDPNEMFNRVFIPEVDPTAPPERPSVVDKVRASYKSLRESNRRLSALDRQRLDDHMDRLFELERRLAAGKVRRPACGEARAPEGDWADPRERHAALNDVIAAAFLCGTSRIAVVKVQESSFVPHAGDWHQDVAHQFSGAEPQALLQQANQQAFEHAVLDLAYKLDVDDGSGRTILESSLIQWTQECGETTHESRSAPVVTFGSAGGQLRASNYCDFRKLGPAGIVNRWGGDIGPSGLLHAQWLAMALRVMGVEPSEFQDIEHNAPAGYGYDHVEEAYQKVQSAGVVDGASDPLPFLAG